MTVGPDGALWFTLPGSIGRMTTTGAFQQYPGPAVSNLLEWITLGPDGALWFTDASQKQIGRLIPVTSSLQLFPLPAQPYGLIAGGDGNLWFAEYPRGLLGRLTPTGQVTEFALDGTSIPNSLIWGPDATPWFAEPLQHEIAHLLLTNGVIEGSPLPTPQEEPEFLTFGPDGACWFTETYEDRIGRLDLGTGTITEYTLPPKSEPAEITSGPDGALWVVETGLNGHRGTKIGRFLPPGH